MNKAMLLLGMAGGATITYLMLNSNTRQMMKDKVNCMFDSMDKMLDK